VDEFKGEDHGESWKSLFIGAAQAAPQLTVHTFSFFNSSTLRTNSALHSVESKSSPEVIGHNAERVTIHTWKRTTARKLLCLKKSFSLREHKETGWKKSNLQWVHGFFRLWSSTWRGV
jgi:hypothetical protein